MDPEEKGKQKEVRHSRPITLFGIGTKVLPKVISLQFNKLILYIQLGFIKDYNILNNVFTS